ncbi:hypothetical protein M9Y10_043083 [Tritrichomonas musculus]|uniref:Uncharacterized protein n=1 Tax=Tritrichomonas musculus TaxID=1915356 RepID=A0ABR2JYP5_9EUKA
MTALHCCAKRNLFDYVNILVNHKDIILNPKDIDGVLIFVFIYRTPLDMCRGYLQNKMAEYLEKIYKEKKLLE